MRGGSYGLVALGVILLILGLVNHYLLKLNPVAHTSTIVVAVGGILALVGLILYFMGGRASSTAG